MFIKNIKLSRVFISIPIFLTVFIGCKVVDYDKINATVENATRALKESSDKISLAVPGERYHRLIDDFHGGDPEKKDKVKKVLESLFQVNFDEKYEVSVWFGYKNVNKIRADIFRYPIDGKTAVIHHIQNKRYNEREIGNSLIRPKTFKEIYTKSKEQIDSAIDRFQLYQLTGPYCNEYDKYNYIFAQCGGNSSNMELIFKDNFKKVGDAINRSIERYLSENNMSYADDKITMDWNVMDGAVLLFVLIPIDDWDKVGGDVEVSCVVHKKNDPKATLLQDSVYTFKKGEFSMLKIDSPAVSGGSIMYASHNMIANSSIISAQLIEASKSLEKMIKEYSSANTN